jgi:hypothetical protein
MKSGLEPGTLCFECNICGERCLVAIDQLQREVASCEACGSTPRLRAIRALSRKLFGQNLILPDFPVSRGVSGLGMTDWDGYAKRLAEKFSYENTYFHQEPYLDVSAKQIASERLRVERFCHLLGSIGTC